ncbi:MAG: hypothetical protein J5940_07260 [Clostridia bacterium]|nr:hypothetical protein [Clostridia bacterium]
MSTDKKSPSLLRTVLFAVLGALAVPLALSLALREFYCYASNHLYTLSQAKTDMIWYVSDVLAEMGVFFGIGLIAAGLSQKIRLSWIAIPVSTVYAVVCPILLYTAEYSSHIFLTDEEAAEGFAAAMRTLETYLIYIIVSLFVTFVFITAHAVRENRGKARPCAAAGFFSPFYLPAAIGYAVSALMLAVVIVSSVAVGNSFPAFLLSVLVALLRAVFVFLGILSAGRKTE